MAGVARRQRIAYIFVARRLVDASNNWRSVLVAPLWCRNFNVRALFRFFILQQMLQRAWNFLDSARRVEEIHLVVFVPHLIRQTASPCFDLVELVFLFIVP